MEPKLTIDPNALYDINDVAEKCGFNVWYLRDASQKGKLPVTQMGKTILVKGDALAKYFEGSKLSKRKVTKPTAETVAAE